MGNLLQAVMAPVRKFYSAHQEAIDGVVKAFLEVAITALFTFIPFLIFSVPFVQGDGPLNSEHVFDNFLAYWGKGEIVFPLLAMCGAVVSLVSINKVYYHWGMVLSSTVGALFIAMGGWCCNSPFGRCWFLFK